MLYGIKGLEKGNGKDPKVAQDKAEAKSMSVGALMMLVTFAVLLLIGFTCGVGTMVVQYWLAGLR